MPVDAATVTRIASLARIKLTDAETLPLAGELSAILQWVEQLGEVDTTGIAPMAAVMPITRAWRPDVIDDGGIRADVLANATDAQFGFFAVPKVID